MPRRKPMSKGPWDDPISPLQAARFAKRQTRQEIVDLVHLVCPGKGGEECRLDADKLGEYERGGRRPGIEHVTALCRVFNKSPEELGLIQWRTEQVPEPDDEAGTTASPVSDAEAPGHANGQTAVRPVINGTNQTAVGYPGGGIGSQLLALSGDWTALTDHSAQDERGPGVSADMQRLRFLQGVSAAAGAAIVDPVIHLARRVSDELAFTKVSASEIDRLTHAAYRHARNYYQLHQPGHAEVLLVDWATAGHLLRLPQTPSQRRTLSDTYARLCGILGYLSHDSRMGSRARTLFQAGEEAAREAGDTVLLAWLYDCHSLIGDWGGDPAEVVDLTQHGLSALGRDANTARTAAKLHGRAARAYAALGDHREAIANLDAAERILSQATHDCWPGDANMPRGFTYASELLMFDMGLTHTRLGQWATARSFTEQTGSLQEELGLSARTAAGIPNNKLNLATALLHLGAPEEATRVAAEAIDLYRGVAEPAIIHRGYTFARRLAQRTTPRQTEPYLELLRERERLMLEASQSGA